MQQPMSFMTHCSSAEHVHTPPQEFTSELRHEETLKVMLFSGWSAYRQCETAAVVPGSKQA